MGDKVVTVHLNLDDKAAQARYESYKDKTINLDINTKSIITKLKAIDTVIKQLQRSASNINLSGKGNVNIGNLNGISEQIQSVIREVSTAEGKLNAISVAPAGRFDEMIDSIDAIKNSFSNLNFNVDTSSLEGLNSVLSSIKTNIGAISSVSGVPGDLSKELDNVNLKMSKMTKEAEVEKYLKTENPYNKNKTISRKYLDNMQEYLNMGGRLADIKKDLGDHQDLGAWLMSQQLKGKISTKRPLATMKDNARPSGSIAAYHALQQEQANLSGEIMEFNIAANVKNISDVMSQIQNAISVEGIDVTINPKVGDITAFTAELQEKLNNNGIELKVSPISQEEVSDNKISETEKQGKSKTTRKTSQSDYKTDLKHYGDAAVQRLFGRTTNIEQDLAYDTISSRFKKGIAFNNDNDFVNAVRNKNKDIFKTITNAESRDFQALSNIDYSSIDGYENKLRDLQGLLDGLNYYTDIDFDFTNEQSVDGARRLIEEIKTLKNELKTLQTDAKKEEKQLEADKKKSQKEIESNLKKQQEQTRRNQKKQKDYEEKQQVRDYKRAAINEINGIPATREEIDERRKIQSKLSGAASDDYRRSVNTVNADIRYEAFKKASKGYTKAIDDSYNNVLGKDYTDKVDSLKKALDDIRNYRIDLSDEKSISGLQKMVDTAEKLKTELIEMQNVYNSNLQNQAKQEDQINKSADKDYEKRLKREEKDRETIRKQQESQLAKDYKSGIQKRLTGDWRTVTEDERKAILEYRNRYRSGNLANQSAVESMNADIKRYMLNRANKGFTDAYASGTEYFKNIDGYRDKANELQRNFNELNNKELNIDTSKSIDEFKKLLDTIERLKSELFQMQKDYDSAAAASAKEEEQLDKQIDQQMNQNIKRNEIERQKAETKRQKQDLDSYQKSLMDQLYGRVSSKESRDAAIKVSDQYRSGDVEYRSLVDSRNQAVKEGLLSEAQKGTDKLYDDSFYKAIPEYEKKVNELKSAINDLSNSKIDISTPENMERTLGDLQKIFDTIKKTKAELTGMQSDYKKSQNKTSSVKTESSDITAFNTGISSMASGNTMTRYQKEMLSRYYKTRRAISNNQNVSDEDRAFSEKAYEQRGKIFNDLQKSAIREFDKIKNNLTTNSSIDGYMDLFRQLETEMGNLDNYKLNIDSGESIKGLQNILSKIQEIRNEMNQLSSLYNSGEKAELKNFQGAFSKLLQGKSLSDQERSAYENVSDNYRRYLGQTTRSKEEEQYVSSVQAAQEKGINSIMTRYGNALSKAQEPLNTPGLRVNGYENKVIELESAIDRFKAKVEELKTSKIDLNTEQAQKELGDLGKEIDIIGQQLKSNEYIPIGQKEINGLGQYFNNVKANNSKAVKAFSGDFKSIETQINNLVSGKSTKADRDNITEQIGTLVNKFQAAGKAGMSFGDIWKQRLTSLGAYLSTFASFYQIVNVAKQTANAVREVDTAMTELEKVSDVSGQRLQQSFETSKQTAQDLGATVTEVINATADWSRLGYTQDQAEELAKVAVIYEHVGDGINIDQANQSLISTLQGFNMEATDAMEIVDKFNEVANNEPIDSAGIGEALQRSAASFQAANTDLSESIALITGANSVVQDPSRVGNMWKTNFYCLIVQQCA